MLSSPRIILVPGAIRPLLAVLLALIFTIPGAAGEAESLDALLTPVFSTPTTVTSKDIERNARRLAGDQRLIYATVGWELIGSPIERITILSPLVDGRREFAATHPGVVCSLAEAQARGGALDKASATLALLPADGCKDLDVADLASVQARIELIRNQPEEAGRQACTSREALRKAVPEAAYETWRSRLVRLRLTVIEREIEDTIAIAKVGSACWAWLAADKIGKDAAYQDVCRKFPDTLFAAAAALERARLYFDARDGKGCLAIIDEQRLTAGDLAVPALLLRGDALIILRKQWAEARPAYEAAVKVLGKSTAPLEGITPAMRSAIVPGEPLHRIGRWNYPAWVPRPVGTIQSPALDAETTNYLRYQAMLRLSVMAAAAGDRPSAVTLARAMLSFDQMDQQEDQKGNSSGSSRLAYTFETNHFVIPLQLFDGLTPDLRAQVLLAAAFYQVADWANASAWSTNLIDLVPPSQGVAHHGVLSLAACAEEMLHHDDKAMALAARVHLKSGIPPNQAWYIARYVEIELLQCTCGTCPPEQCKSLAIMKKVCENAPGTAFAMEALIFLADHSTCHDMKLARQYYLRFRSLYPKERAESITFMINEIDKRLAGKPSFFDYGKQPSSGDKP